MASLIRLYHEEVGTPTRGDNGEGAAELRDPIAEHHTGMEEGGKLSRTRARLGARARGQLDREDGELLSRVLRWEPAPISVESLYRGV